MNTKQLIISFLMLLVFCSFYAYAVCMIPKPLEAFKFMVAPTVAILLAGFGLVYIFRDKEKG